MHRPIFITHPTKPKDRRIAFHDRMIGNVILAGSFDFFFFFFLDFFLSTTPWAGRRLKLLKWYLFSTSEAVNPSPPESPGHSHEVPTEVLGQKAEHLVLVPHVLWTTLHLLNIPSKLQHVAKKKKHLPKGPRVDTCTQPTEQGAKISSRWVSPTAWLFFRLEGDPVPTSFPTSTSSSETWIGPGGSSTATEATAACQLTIPKKSRIKSSPNKKDNKPEKQLTAAWCISLPIDPKGLKLWFFWGMAVDPSRSLWLCGHLWLLCRWCWNNASIGSLCWLCGHLWPSSRWCWGNNSSMDFWSGSLGLRFGYPRCGSNPYSRASCKSVQYMAFQNRPLDTALFRHLFSIRVVVWILTVPFPCSSLSLSNDKLPGFFSI